MSERRERTGGKETDTGHCRKAWPMSSEAQSMQALLIPLLCLRSFLFLYFSLVLDPCLLSFSLLPFSLSPPSIGVWA